MILGHKDPNVLTSIYFYKIRYRDEKRMKIKIALADEFGLPSSYPFNAEVSSGFFDNFCKGEEKPILHPDHEDLLKLDEEKEDYYV